MKEFRQAWEHLLQLPMNEIEMRASALPVDWQWELFYRTPVKPVTGAPELSLVPMILRQPLPKETI